MELPQHFQTLKERHLKEPYASLSQRRENLLLLKKILQENAEALAEQLSYDFSHRSRFETLVLELFPAINTINYCIKNLKKWAKPRKRHVSWLFKPASAYLLPQPLGVVGIVVPWNYPLLLAIGPLAYALAAGNRVMIKMSELTAAVGGFFEQLIQNSRLAETIQIVNGDIEIAKSFSQLPFGHLLFTGSPKVGSQVMKAAAEHLTPVTLELGGKSPVFISNTLKPQFLKRLFMAKVANAGQTCIAPDFLLIPKNREQLIEDEFRQFIDEHYPNLIDNQDYSSIISTEHKQRLENILKDAEMKGARIVTIGDGVKNGRKLPIHLIFNASLAMKVMQEEIFGPILPVLCYQSLNDALEQINAFANPLVLYYYGSDQQEIEQLSMRTLSGALCINDSLTYIGIDDLPFGGVGQSGMGYYHAQEGFDVFSKLKAVFVQKRFNMVPWFYPPYGWLTTFLLTKISGLHLKEKK
nr:aldehyde dehydrogenase family protein [Legionella jordanis]